METSPAHDITKVILSTLRAPGVSPHSVVLRHAVDDLESGHTSRALRTLIHAGETLNLKVFVELSRFIEGKTAHLESVINSAAWADMISTLNMRRYRWQAIVESNDMSQLIAHARHLRAQEVNRFTSHIPDNQRTEQALLSASASQSVSSLASGQAAAQSESQTKSSAQLLTVEQKPRINYTAALVTFLVTLAGVLMWWSRT